MGAPRRAVALVVLLALATLGAGCFGATEEVDPQETGGKEGGVGAPPGPADLAAPGWVRGTVVDDALVAVPGAVIRLQPGNATAPNLNLSATADAQGRFEFRDLPNGRFLIRGEKAGYRAGSQWAEVRNGTVFELTLRLDPLPDLTVYGESFELSGLLSCAAVVVAPSGRTPLECGTADPNQRHRFVIPVNPDAQALVVELAWKATTPASSRLLLKAETKDFGDLDTVLGSQDGGDGYVRLEVGSGVMGKYYTSGGELVVSVAPAPSLAGDEAATDAGLAFQQTFTLVATPFYHGPPPAGFAVLAAPAS